MAEDRLSQAELETLLATMHFDARPPAEKVSAATVAPRVATISTAGRSEPAASSALDQRQLAAMRAACERFAATLAPAISRLVRADVQISLTTLDVVRFGEFLARLEQLTCLNVLRAGSQSAPWLLDQSPSIVYPIIDRMLGGGREPAIVPSRPLTEIEQRLWSRATALCLQSLANAWNEIEALELRVDRIESRPSAARTMPVEHFVVRARFEVRLDAYLGAWCLCVPIAALDGLKARQLRDSSGQSFRPQHFGSEPVAIAADLAQSTIAPPDLAALEIGDIISTDEPVGSTVTITVDGVPKFEANAGSRDGRKALCITAPVDPSAADAKEQDS